MLSETDYLIGLQGLKNTIHIHNGFIGNMTLNKQSIRKHHKIYANGKIISKEELIIMSQLWTEEQEEFFRKMLKQGGKFSIQGNYIQENKNISKTKIINDSTNWKYIINNEKLFPDKEHLYNDLIISRKINYIKLNIFPDGGIARINIFGKINKK